MLKARAKGLLGALAVLVGAASCASPGPGSPDQTAQGWSEEQRSIWYGSSQGSRLIPYAWLVALAQPRGVEVTAPGPVAPPRDADPDLSHAPTLGAVRRDPPHPQGRAAGTSCPRVLARGAVAQSVRAEDS